MIGDLRTPPGCGTLGGVNDDTTSLPPQPGPDHDETTPLAWSEAEPPTPTTEFAPLDAEQSALQEEPAVSGSGRPSLRRWIIGGVIGAVLLLVVALTAFEFHARSTLANCIAEQTSKAAHAPAEVSFGAKPLVLTAIDKKLGSMRVTTGVGTAGTTKDASYTVDLEGVDMRDQAAPVADSATITARVGVDHLDEVARNATLGIDVSTVTADPGRGVLVIDIAGIAGIELRPVIRDNKVLLDIVSASAFGIEMPELARFLGNAIDGTVAQLPPTLTRQSASVTATGIEVRLDGSGIALNELAGTPSGEPGPAETCSLI